MDRSRSMSADCKIPDHSTSVWMNQLCCATDFSHSGFFLFLFFSRSKSNCMNNNKVQWRICATVFGGGSLQMSTQLDRIHVSSTSNKETLEKAEKAIKLPAIKQHLDFFFFLSMRWPWHRHEDDTDTGKSGMTFVLQTVLHTCQPIQFTSIKDFFFLIILGGYGHIGKWIQENIIFMRFCCCFKLSKKTEKLLNKQPTYVTAKCTLTGLVQ